MTHDGGIEEQVLMFDEPKTTLFQEIEPKESADHGGLRRTKELKADNGNYFWADTKGFSIDATEIIHINGFEDGPDSSPMTLLVLKILIHSTEVGFKFNSVTTRLAFEGGSRSQGHGPAEPALVAYAPFSSTVAWSVSEEQRQRILSMNGSVGANFAASVSVSGGGQWQVNMTKKYFARGNATPMNSYVDDDRRNGVKWYLQSNQSQEEDVSPEFMVAVLIKRATKDDPFTGTFTIRPGGGTTSEIQQGLRRFFGVDPRRTTKEFDPSPGVKTRFEGADLVTACEIDQNKLGKLRKSDSLTGLAHVWGLDLVLPPPTSGGSKPN